MSPVYKLSANSVKNGRTVYGSMLAGNTAYVIPSWYDSIATVTVGSGGASNIEFTSIPSDYTHLQVRGILRLAGIDQMILDLNSTSGGWTHSLYGDGSTVGASYYGSDIRLFFDTYLPTATSTFGAVVIDILDYKNTNKNKTVRMLGGYDSNGAGNVTFSSGSRNLTGAITSLKFRFGQNPQQYSTLALYGIKGA